jgi:DMSO/TMAO reductase YedYZ molybdopterin-dependent catalytic subunit
MGRLSRIYTTWVRIPLGPALLSGAVSVVAAVLTRWLLRVPMPAELYGDRITVLIPLPIFTALLGIFGSNAKHLFFVGLVLASGLLAAALGVLYWDIRRLVGARAQGRAGGSEAGRMPAFTLGLTPGYADVPVLAIAMYAIALLVLSPLLGAGFLGSALFGGIGAAVLSLLAPILAPSIAFVALLHRQADAQGAEAPAPGGAAANAAGRASPAAGVSRRRLLRDAGFAAAALGLAALAWEFVSSGLGTSLGIAAPPARNNLDFSNTPERITPPPTPTYGPWTAVSGQTDEITTADGFYYVSKNFASDPQIDAGSWRLEIGGQVSHPYRLSYSQLRALPVVERYHTLECISNEVGGDLMSNAYFRGVSLADLLDTAGIQPGASELVFHAADGYSDRLHLAQALDPRSLVVYEIDGAPLPEAHGFPARLLVPGLYGMKNCKWLTQLTVDSGDYTGYWEQQGWTNEAHIKTMTRIDTPLDGDLLDGKPTYIAGVAFAADRGIARVDVSTDGGASWQTATLRQPLGPLTWVLWELPWTPGSGGHDIVARAVELDGTVQTPQEAPPLPDGASGYHVIHVTAR